MPAIVAPGIAFGQFAWHLLLIQESITRQIQGRDVIVIVEFAPLGGHGRNWVVGQGRMP